MYEHVYGTNYKCVNHSGPECVQFLYDARWNSISVQYGILLYTICLLVRERVRGYKRTLTISPGADIELFNIQLYSISGNCKNIQYQPIVFCDKKIQYNTIQYIFCCLLCIFRLFDSVVFKKLEKKHLETCKFKATILIFGRATIDLMHIDVFLRCVTTTPRMLVRYL
jgi:hypothetical protein